MAFYIASRHPEASVWINDAYAPLVAFWRVVQDPIGAAELHARIVALKAGADEAKLYEANLWAREVLASGDVDELSFAVAVYAANRTAFSAVLGTYSKSAAVRWLRQDDDRLLSAGPLMKGWRITCYDYSLVADAPWTGCSPFLFLDPPYETADNTLYGLRGSRHLGFDHGRFQAQARAAQVPTMVTLNAGFFPEFANFPICRTYHHGYTMQSRTDYRRRQVTRLELVACNYADAEPMLIAAE